MAMFSFFLPHPKRFNDVEVSVVKALLVANGLTLFLAGVTNAFTPEEVIMATARRVLWLSFMAEKNKQAECNGLFRCFC